MITILILAGGQGTRMCSDLPKVLHPVGGKPMVHHVIDVALEIKPSQIVTVLSPLLNAELVKEGRAVITTVQPNPLGTGNAVKIGLEALSDIPKTVVILCGDTPLLEAKDLQDVIRRHQAQQHPSITVVGMRPDQPNSYGRIIADQEGQIERIVEYRDALLEECAVPLCNSGVIVADGDLLKRLVCQLSPSKNQANEYYLTDIVALARQAGVPSWVTELPAGTLQGINTRVDLAAAETALQTRWRQRFMEQGVTLIDPQSVFFSYDTQVGRDVTIWPNVTFGLGVKIGNRVYILPGCHVEKSTLGDDITIGPFAHLRKGAILGDHVAIGNFVEVKNTTLGAHTKAKHLSYLGDATIGQNVNIGAGTITCNHNGFVKSSTYIRDGAYVGSNSCLVAPVSIGTGAIVAAGSVVSEDVPDDALGIARHRQENKLKWAARFRARYQ